MSLVLFEESWRWTGTNIHHSTWFKRLRKIYRDERDCKEEEKEKETKVKESWREHKRRRSIL